MKRAIILGFTLLLFLVYVPMSIFAQALDEKAPPPPPPADDLDAAALEELPPPPPEEAEYGLFQEFLVPPPPPPASDGEAGAFQELPPPPPSPQDNGGEKMIQEPKKVQEKKSDMVPPPPPPPEVEVLYLTEEEESATLKYVEEMDPGHAVLLRKIKEFDRQQYREKLSLVYREHRALKRIKERDPERYKRLLREKELEIKSHKLVAEYKATESDSEQQKLRKDLVELLSRLFDLRQLNREGEIRQLEMKLEDLKELSKARIEKKDEIVQRRLAKLLKENKDLEW